MPALLWLPDVLRRAGLTVHEVDGWRARTNRSYRVDQADPRAIVCHATAGSRSASDQQEIAVLLHGSKTAPAPIAQLYLGRNGHWWVVAAGVCNHIGDAALPGTGVAGNRYAIGVEAANDNRGEPWPAIQYQSYVTGVAAICQHMGWPVSRVSGHKEISSTGKTDPTFDMNRFRRDVAAAMSGVEELNMSAVDTILQHTYRNYLLTRYGVAEAAQASDPSKRQAPCLQTLHEQQVVMLANQAAMRAALEQLAAAVAAGTGVDPAAIRAAVEDGVDAALARAGAALTQVGSDG